MISYPFDVKGVLTRVFEAGSGDRYVVMVHGAGSRADRWQHNIEPIALGGFHLFALDLPGHGFAKKGSEVDCSVLGYTTFLLDFLDAMGIKEVVFVGTSLGGHVAASAALCRSDQVRALVLVGTTGLYPNGLERRMRTSGRLRDTTQDGIIEKLHALIYNNALITRDWVREEFMMNNSLGAVASFDTLARYFEERIDDDCIGEAIARLSERLPIMLVWGIQDSMVAVEIGRRAHQAMPTSQFVEIDATGHAPYFERPEIFNTAVLKFLAPVYT